MFDGNFRTAADRRTAPVGRWLYEHGVTADVLTGTGILLAIGCAVAIGSGNLLLGFGLLVASALPDLLDGPVAKAAGTQSVRGAFFDSVADRVSDSLVLGGIAWFLMDTEGGTIAALPLALLAVSQLISYERAKAEIHGFDAKGGLMERAERVIALCIGLVFSAILVPILWVVLTLTAITAVQRFLKVWRQATDANPALLARRRETPPLMRGLFQSWSDVDESRRRRWRERAGNQKRNSRKR